MIFALVVVASTTGLILLDVGGSTVATEAVQENAPETILPTPDPAEELVGTWSIAAIPCADARPENGQQELRRNNDGNWTVNGTEVSGAGAPTEEGWFEIDELYWRVIDGQLHLSVDGEGDDSATIFERCGP